MVREGKEMSRIGRAPITIPAGVTVTVGAENFVTVKGPKGELKQSFNPAMTIAVEGNVLTVSRPDEIGRASCRERVCLSV